MSLIKAGQLINITTGEYSDYCLRATLRALKDFDTEKAYAAYPKLSEDEACRLGCGYDSAVADLYLSWLIKEGYAEDVDASEVVELWVDISWGTHIHAANTREPAERFSGEEE